MIVLDAMVQTAMLMVTLVSAASIAGVLIYLTVAAVAYIHERWLEK